MFFASVLCDSSLLVLAGTVLCEFLLGLFSVSVLCDWLLRVFSVTVIPPLLCTPQSKANVLCKCLLLVFFASVLCECFLQLFHMSSCGDCSLLLLAGTFLCEFLLGLFSVSVLCDWLLRVFSVTVIPPYSVLSRTGQLFSAEQAPPTPPEELTSHLTEISQNSPVSSAGENSDVTGVKFNRTKKGSLWYHTVEICI